MFTENTDMQVTLTLLHLRVGKKHKEENKTVGCDMHENDMQESLRLL